MEILVWIAFSPIILFAFLITLFICLAGLGLVLAIGLILLPIAVVVAILSWMFE